MGGIGSYSSSAPGQDLWEGGRSEVAAAATPSRGGSLIDVSRNDVSDDNDVDSVGLFFRPLSTTALAFLDLFVEAEGELALGRMPSIESNSFDDSSLFTTLLLDGKLCFRVSDFLFFVVLSATSLIGISCQEEVTLEDGNEAENRECRFSFSFVEGSACVVVVDKDRLRFLLRLMVF